MTRVSPSEFTYQRYVANYAVRYLDCPGCGAGARQACTMAEPGKIVCHARWVLAKAEVEDPDKRRPYQRDTIGARRRAESGERSPDSVVVPLADPHASPEWRYRKLREFLAPRGVILAKIRGTDAYRIIQDGRLITASISLAGAESWAVHYWEPRRSSDDGNRSTGTAGTPSATETRARHAQEPNRG
jgi:hypothetical protein